MGAGMLFLDDARITACVGQAIWDDIIILDHLMLYTLVCLCVHGDNSGQLKLGQGISDQLTGKTGKKIFNKLTNQDTFDQ